MSLCIITRDGYTDEEHLSKCFALIWSCMIPCNYLMNYFLCHQLCWRNCPLLGLFGFFSYGPLLPHALSTFQNGFLTGHLHIYSMNLYGYHKGKPQKIFDVPLIISINFTLCDLFCFYYLAFILVFLH